MKKVFIVEDDKELRESFEHIVSNSKEYAVSGAYESAEDALSQVLYKKPDYILLDINLPGIDGIKAIDQFKNKLKSVEVIIVTVFEDHDYVFEALKAGASGYITKSNNYLEILHSLDEVASGGAPMSSKIAKMVINNFQLARESPLSKREQSILQLLSDGKTYSQISEKLFISKDTTKSHIRNIYQKLQVHSKSEAIDKGKDQRLIS